MELISPRILRLVKWNLIMPAIWFGQDGQVVRVYEQAPVTRNTT